jgi:hypothetical protein
MRLGAIQKLLRIFRLFSGIYSHFSRAISIYWNALKSFLDLQILYLGSSHPKSSLVIFLNFSELSENFSWFNYDFRIF